MSRASPPPKSDWHTRHLWQIQPVRDLLVIAGLVGLVYLGYRLSLVTVPLLLALGLAYLFEPVVRAMVRTKWFNRPLAAATIIVVAGVAIVVPAILGATFAVIQGFEFGRDVLANLDEVKLYVEEPSEEKLRALPGEFWQWLATEVHDNRENWLKSPLFEWLAANAEAIGSQVMKTGADAVTVLLKSLVSFGVLLFMAFLTAFFFFFMCTSFGSVLKFWEGLLPERKKGRYIDLARQMDRVIAAFIRGRLVIAAFQAVLFTVGYWLVGVPAPLLVGPLVAVLAILPYVSLVGIPLCILLMFLEPATGFRGEWWWILIAPAMVYGVGQAMDDYVLSPRIQGKGTGMDAPTILFASLAGGVLAGFYGLLLAIPVAACIKILLRELFWPRFRAWAEGREEDILPIENH
jgi:predicted PurR-regulated permease PerM